MQKDSKEAVWSARIQEQEKSGLNISRWCQQIGVSEATFYYWRKRLSEAATPCQLIALPMPSAAPPVLALEVQTPQGYVIRLSSHAHISWLSDVLGALR